MASSLFYTDVLVRGADGTCCTLTVDEWAEPSVDSCEDLTGDLDLDRLTEACATGLNF